MTDITKTMPLADTAASPVPAVKTGLILEGGAMRGMFTEGVLDVMLEAGITYDGAIGVSAGAAFGCNFKSHQIGRALRYNKTYCRDKRYCSLRSLLLTGDLYNADFCYRILPQELDIFDTKTYQADPMAFYAAATDVATGRAVYQRLDTGEGEDLQWFRASASLPIVSRPVRIGGGLYLDGGIADSVPLRFFESLGYTKNVVLLTQPKGYRKKQKALMPLYRRLLRRYPALAAAVEDRPRVYNETMAYIEEKEKSGQIFVIRPPESLRIGASEKDPDELQRVYDIGRRTGEAVLSDLKAYLA